MDNDKYLKVGNLIIVDGIKLVERDVYDDGLAFGEIYKNEEAYNQDWDAICYIPEACFADSEQNEDGLYIDPDGYTHNDLLAMCFGNRELCDAFFQSLIWACPETYLNEWDDIDYAYYYQFIKLGAKVWWNDPAGETSGEYTVWGVPFEFNEYGEPIEPDTFGLDVVIIIGNENSEAEVTPSELTPVYPELKTETK